MQPHSRRRRHRAALAFGLVLLAGGSLLAEETVWTVAVVGGKDGQVRCSGLSTDGDPIVEVSSVAALLGVDADASARDGAGYLPLAVIAHAAGFQTVVASGQRAYLLPLAPPAAAAPPSTGWALTRVPKSLAELEEMRRAGAPGPAAPVRSSGVSGLPPQQASLMFGTGLGYVAGHDWATQFDLDGAARGYRMTGNAFFTRGELGLRYLYGRGEIETPSSAWMLQIGDLFGELRGLTRGVRVVHRPRGRWSPSVAAYVPVGDPSPRPLLAYRDRLHLTSRLETATELSSDGSLFVRASVVYPRLQTDVFYRRARTQPQPIEDRGVSASLVVGGGISLFGAARTSHGRGADRWIRGGVTMPLARGALLTLDQTRTRTGGQESRGHAAFVALPLGRVQIFQRFQTTDTAFIDGRGVDLSYRQLQSSASYVVSPRLHVLYQVGTQWFQQGSARPFNEVQASITLRRGTVVRLTSSVPDMSDPQRLNLRLTHALTRSWNLTVEAGRLSTFQPISHEDADARRAMVFLTKGFRVRTPAGGGTVHGRVVDQDGAGVEGAVVRLGPYQIPTDATGAYRVSHVPLGSHTLDLDRDALHAGYGPGDTERTVSITSARAIAADLHAVRLGAVAGRVYVDRNANGTFDSGEGLAGAVVFIGGQATVTDDNGEFGFLNVLPAASSVELDTSRLRADLTAASPAAVPAVAGRAPARVEFRLVPKSKAIRWQPWPEP